MINNFAHIYIFFLGCPCIVPMIQTLCIYKLQGTQIYIENEIELIDILGTSVDNSKHNCHLLHLISPHYIHSLQISVDNSKHNCHLLHLISPHYIDSLRTSVDNSKHNCHLLHLISTPLHRRDNQTLCIMNIRAHYSMLEMKLISQMKISKLG